MGLTHKGKQASVDYGLYEGLYAGYSPMIHDYKFYNSNRALMTRTLDTLNMPKMIGEDLASLIIGEGVEIQTGIEELDLMIEDKFIPDFSQFIEKYMAIGQGIIVPFIEDNLLKWNSYTGTEFEVLEWANMRPSKILIDEKYYDIIISVEDDKTYVEYKKNDRKQQPKGFEMPDDYSLDGVINYFKPSITNNITFNYQGMSVYANAIDILKNIDKTYTDLRNEYDLSRKRMLIPPAMVRYEEYDDNGDKQSYPVFDETEIYYQVIGGNDAEYKPEEVSSDIRIQQYEDGIKLNLKLLSASVGLDEYYDFDKGLVSRATATQVISDNSKLFRNKVKHEQLIIKELTLLINMFANLLDKEVKDLVINFDDSIIIDDDKQMELDFRKVDMGLMSKKKFIEKWENYDDKELEEELSLISDAKDLFPEG